MTITNRFTVHYSNRSGMLLKQSNLLSTNIACVTAISKNKVPVKGVEFFPPLILQNVNTVAGGGSN